MNDVDVPSEVRRLLAERVDSIPELEALLLLRQYRDRTWGVDETGKHLYLRPAVAFHVLSVLTERGFLIRTAQRYQYSPESSELDADVTLLAETYSSHLIAVTNIVHAKPNARPSSPALPRRKDT